jgi:hypothetical protein
MIVNFLTGELRELEVVVELKPTAVGMSVRLVRANF